MEANQFHTRGGWMIINTSGAAKCRQRPYPPSKKASPLNFRIPIKSCSSAEEQLYAQSKYHSIKFFQLISSLCSWCFQPPTSHTLPQRWYLNNNILSDFLSKTVTLLKKLRENKMRFFPAHICLEAWGTQNSYSLNETQKKQNAIPSAVRQCCLSRSLRNAKQLSQGKKLWMAKLVVAPWVG